MEKMTNVSDVYFEILLVECVDKMNLGFVFICYKISNLVRDTFEITAHSSKSPAT